MSANEIAEVPHDAPATVRRWITATMTNASPGYPTVPAPDGPAKSADAWANPSVGCCRQRKPGPPAASRGLGADRRSAGPRCAAAGANKPLVRARLIAKSDPDHDQICAHVRDQIIDRFRRARHRHRPSPQRGEEGIRGVLLLRQQPLDAYPNAPVICDNGGTHLAGITSNGSANAPDSG